MTFLNFVPFFNWFILWASFKKKGFMNKVLPVAYLKRKSSGLQEHVLKGDGDVAASPDTKRALGFGREADPM